MPNQFDSASKSFRRRLNFLPIFRLFTNTQTPFETRRSFRKGTRCAYTTKTDRGTHRPAQKPNQPRLLSTSLRRSPSTTSETTLISASPLHSPAPRSFRRVSPVRPDQACSTVRCKRRSWLAVSGTSLIYSAVRCCTRSRGSNVTASTFSAGD